MPMERSALITPFYPALDGLRAFAIILVIALHFGWQVWWNPVMRWCWVGVDLFFVLSGFLITGILFDSLSKPDFFKVFYSRRALRIFPLYYGFWLMLLLLTPLFHFQWNRYVFSMVLYLGNLFEGAAHPPPSLLLYRSLAHPTQWHGLSTGHLWSLCVEEQFYLVWPAVVWLLRSRKALLRICLGVIAFLPCLRAVAIHRHPQLLIQNGLYHNTFARMDTLLIGAALALWLRGPAPKPETLRRWGYAVACGAILSLAVFFHEQPTYAFNSIGYTLVGFASGAMVLLAISPGSLPFRLLQWKPLTGVGRVSYGMYFFHGLFLDFAAAKLPFLLRYHLALVSPVIAFAATFALAQLSFRYFESPFLRLKERFSRRAGAIADPPPSGVPLHREARSVSSEEATTAR